MNMKKNIYLALVAFVLMFIMSGCLGYGKIRSQSGYGDDITIAKLKENWRDYTVYYAGYAVNNPSGIMFDPKNDDKKLLPSDRWTKIEDQETLAEVISWIKIQNSYNVYPRLYRILGPEDQLYGYLFSALSQLVTKVVDDKALWVYDLPEPNYNDDGNGHGIRTPRL